MTAFRESDGLQPAGVAEPAVQSSLARGDYQSVIDSLESAILWLRWASLGIFAVGAGMISFAIWKLPQMANEGVSKIVENPDNSMVAVFELVRGAAYAAVVVSLVFGILSLGRAALDQATRYQKRLMAARFMHYVLVEFQTEVRRGDIKLADIVRFIDAWSRNVESAFTNVKFGTGKGKSIRAAYSQRDGVDVGYGDEPSRPGEPERE
ncbi:MAG: hypothetical protein QM658_04710 [Gordonia sp. (in: high G+C Gram-positive bacteria)]